MANWPMPADAGPTPSEIAALRGCDSEASYYGIGVPVDFQRARQCAFLERDPKDSPVLGGPAILMMVYANGQGVPADFNLALRFACELGGADFELGGRVLTLMSARSRNKLDTPLDVCAHVTSGFATGYCVARQERISAVARRAREQAAAAGMPERELAELRRRSTEFFKTRAEGEVDMSGTMRAALSIAEEAALEDGYVASLEKLRDPKFLPQAAEPRQLESRMAEVMARIMACKALRNVPEELTGAVTSAGISKTQRRWLGYREAFVALAAKVRPDTERTAWRAWVTAARLEQLEELSGLC
ncbi:MAG TPA: hypothetical protein VGK73_05580 [Polyangiaceae bacterium]